MCLLLSLLLAAAAAVGQPLSFKLMTEEALEQRLRLAHHDNAERYQRLKTLFDESGCRSDAIREQKVSGSKQPNIICTLAGSGESPRKIVIGAHFDSVGGDGVIDNWSGAAMLPSLFELLHSAPRRHTFEFVGFAAEEKGLLGSRAYLRSIPKADRSSIAATVIMDSLGLTPTKCWVNGSTIALANAADAVARALGLDFKGVNVERVGTTDSAPFHDAKIPVLSLHSITQETWTTINGKSDVWKAVSWKDYYDTHRLISALLVYLDQNLP